MRNIDIPNRKLAINFYYAYTCGQKPVEIAAHSGYSVGVVSQAIYDEEFLHNAMLCKIRDTTLDPKTWTCPISRVVVVNDGIKLFC